MIPENEKKTLFVVFGDFSSRQFWWISVQFLSRKGSNVVKVLHFVIHLTTYTPKFPMSWHFQPQQRWVSVQVHGDP